MVWSADGRCELFNSRLLEVLELRKDDLHIGLAREDFFAAAVARGDVTGESAAQARIDFTSGKDRFCADRRMASGRILAIETRRLPDGGHVTSYTDVTLYRRNAEELTQAKQKAEEAELTALRALAAEQAWRKEARLLSELDEWLQSCKSLEELYKITAAFMAQILPGSAGEIYIYANSRDVLDGVCSWGGRRCATTSFRTAAGRCAAGGNTGSAPIRSPLPAPMCRIRSGPTPPRNTSACRLSRMATRSG